jgi:hypothetical protein
MAMGRAGNIFSDNYKVVLGIALCETATTAANYPVSGSYVDVSGYERVHIFIHTGTIHNSDTPVYTPKCAEAINGTLDVIDSSLALTPAPAADDGYCFCWTIEVGNLPVDHHFLSLVMSGTLSNGSYGDVLFFLEGREVPVTQTSTVLPAAHCANW